MQIPTPVTKKQVRKFLGAVGYCCLWIHGFSEIVKPLYSAMAGDNNSLEWNEEHEQAFKNLK